MKKLRRIFAMALALIMAMSLMSVMASATGSPDQAKHKISLSYAGNKELSTPDAGRMDAVKYAELADAENGIVKITMDIAGAPITSTQGVDAVVVADESSSMNMFADTWSANNIGIVSLCLNEDHWYGLDNEWVEKLYPSITIPEDASEEEKSSLQAQKDEIDAVLVAVAAWESPLYFQLTDAMRYSISSEWGTTLADDTKSVLTAALNALNDGVDYTTYINWSNLSQIFGAGGSYWSSGSNHYVYNAETSVYDKMMLEEDASALPFGRNDYGCCDRLSIEKGNVSTFAKGLLDENDSAENDDQKNRVAYFGFATRHNSSSYRQSVFFTDEYDGALKTAVEFMDSNGYTNWAYGLSGALTHIRNRAAEEQDRPVYVVFITDGAPNQDASDTGTRWEIPPQPEGKIDSPDDLSQFPAAFPAALAAESDGFYAIKYNVDGVAAQPYFELLEDKGAEIWNCATATDIDSVLAGIKAKIGGKVYPSGTLTDVIGEGFTLIEDDARYPISAGYAKTEENDQVTLTWNFENVSRESVSFYVQLDESLRVTPGTYLTNADSAADTATVTGANLTYKALSIDDNNELVEEAASVAMRSPEVTSYTTPVIPPPTPDPEPQPEPPVDKTATPLENDMTNVTLTVRGPEAETVDVAIAISPGITYYQQAVDATINLLKPLISSGVKVKLAVVGVESVEQVILPLTELDPATYETFIDELYAAMPEELHQGPTNLDSPIKRVKELLDADDTVPAKNKYAYVIATGRTYWYEDETTGLPATVVTAYTYNNTEYICWGHRTWQKARINHSSLYAVPGSYRDDWDAYWADIKGWVAEDGDKYVIRMPFSDAEGYDLNAYGEWSATSANGDYINNYAAPIDTPELTAADFVMGEINAISELYSEYGEAVPHALNYERAQYEAYQSYMELVNAGYNVYSICSESVKYQNDSEYITTNSAWANYGWTTSKQIGHSFMDYLAQASGAESANLVFSPGMMSDNFFPAITGHTGAATVAAGSTVEDFIGYDAVKGDFNFVQAAETISLTVDGVPYNTAQTETKEGATSSYAFTASVEGATPAFTLDYYAGEAENEKFIWTFLQDVAADTTVSLTYQLKLTGKTDAAGTHTVETNESATLYPVGGGAVTFPVPSVDYTVEAPEPTPEPETIDITVSKIWNDETVDLPRSGRPAVTINLLAGGEEVDEVTLTEETGWEYTFTDKAKCDEAGAEIVYSITEDAVEGYTSEVDGFTVTNTPVIPEPPFIPEPEIPFVPQPQPEPQPTPDDTIILDEDVPLADVPATGDPLSVMAAVSILSGAGVYFTRKREDEE